MAATLALFSDIDAVKKAENRQRTAEEREGRKRAVEEKRAAARGQIEESPARVKVPPLPISPPAFSQRLLRLSQITAFRSSSNS